MKRSEIKAYVTDAYLEEKTKEDAESLVPDPLLDGVYVIHLMVDGRMAEFKIPKRRRLEHEISATGF